MKDNLKNSNEENDLFEENNMTFTILEFLPPSGGTFANNGASISWEAGRLVFKGPIEESAKLFFEYLKPSIDSYIKMGGKSNLDYLEHLYEEKENNKHHNTEKFS